MVNNRLLVLVRDQDREILSDCEVVLRSEDDRETLEYDEALMRYVATDVDPGTYELEIGGKEGYITDERTIEVEPGENFVQSTLGPEDAMSYPAAGGERVFFRPDRSKRILYARGSGAQEAISRAFEDIEADVQTHDLGERGGEAVERPDRSDEAFVLVDLPEDDDQRTETLATIGTLSGDRRAGSSESDSATSAPSVRVAAPMFHGTEGEEESVSGLTEELIVQFRSDMSEDEVEALATEFGCEMLRRVGYAENGYIWRYPAGDDPYEIIDVIDRLSDHPDTTGVEPNAAVQVEFYDVTPDDLLFAEQTHLSVVDADGAWESLETVDEDLRFGSPEITIAILDSGIDPTHPDLDGALTNGVDKIVTAYDAVNGTAQDPTQLTSAHGTKCASTATALTDDGGGVAGVAGNCRLVGVRNYGSATFDEFATLLVWTAGLPTGDPTLPPAPDPAPDVISNSWGFIGQSVLPAAFDAAFDNITQNGRGGRGCVVLFAASNEGHQPVANLTALAADQRTIAVGASIDADPTNPCTSFHADPTTGRNEDLPAVVDTRTYFSPYGPEIDIVAPSHTSYSLNERDDDGFPLAVDAITAATPVDWGDWVGRATHSSTLTGGASSGDTTITVADGSGFAADEYALVGTAGSDEREFVRITGVSGNDLNVTALERAHPAGTQVITGPNDYSGSEGRTDPARSKGFGGTSHSCPTVAGAAALVLSLRPELTWQEVRDLLRESADHIDVGQTHPQGAWQDNDGDGEVDFSQWYGYGRLNVKRAVETTMASALSVTLDTPNLTFEVPEGVTTVRPVEFSVRSFGPVTFEVDLPITVTNGPGAFDSPYGATVTVPTTDGMTETRYVWISHTGTDPTDVTEGTVTVRSPDVGQEWSVPITATTVPRPSTAVDLVLDKSGSMGRNSGVRTLGGNGISRVDLLKQAAPVLVDLLRDDDGIGTVSFDSDAQPVSDLQPAGPPGVGQGRIEAKFGISGVTPGGNTSVGDGVFTADSRLDAVPPTDYDSKAIVALTDGRENSPRYIADVMGSVDAKRVFAIGLGTQEHLNQGALDDLTQTSGGYLVMTGNLTPDDYFRLMKYYVQILAGVKNEDIVLDPEGRLRPGQEHRIPFELSDADISTDVAVLAPGTDLFELRVETPTGDVVDPRTVNSLQGAAHVVGDSVTYYRLPLPLEVDGREAHAGRWHAVLSVNEEGYRRYLNEIEENDPRGYRVVETHGVRYNCSVSAFSNLRMRATLTQTKRTPGAELTVRAVLREYDELPVENRASVRATLTRPDGTDVTLPMEETEPGIFEASIGADAAGLYRFRVRGEGETLRGHRFTREWELTGSVWHRGDDPYPSARNDPTARSEQFCETLLCLAESFEEYFEERDVDTDRVRECLERYCESVRGSPESEEPGRSDFGRLGGGLTTAGGDGAGYRPSGSAADPELIEALDVLMRRVGGS